MQPAKTIKRPTVQQIEQYGKDLGFTFQDGDAESFRMLQDVALTSFDVISQTADHLPEVKYPRVPGNYEVSPSENKQNAWYQKFSIKGAAEGKLKGKTAVIKDNVCVAGIPLMNGCDTMKGYVPECDATVVERLLDEGAEVIGKAHCESLCLSAGSHTGGQGPVHNPFKQGYMAGGSSSGSAVLVALGEADLAIGGDQGGSIRIPSAWSGCYGMKPTYGLVPTTGAFSIEPTIDHVGPMTNTVENNALMLNVLQGRDGLDDYRQTNCPKDKVDFLEGIKDGVKGLRIGIVTQGFENPDQCQQVNEKVRAAAEKLRALGAEVQEVSIPEHQLLFHVWSGICFTGTKRHMMENDAMFMGSKGGFATSMHQFHQNWRQNANRLSESLKHVLLTAQHIEKVYGNQFYAKSQNILRRCMDIYDKHFENFDLLLMPTAPTTAYKIPENGAPHTVYTASALTMIPNTAPYNITGHPAMSIPCGMVDGLPVGLQLIGNLNQERTIYRAAYAFEQSGDWKQM